MLYSTIFCWVNNKILIEDSFYIDGSIDSSKNSFLVCESISMLYMSSLFSRGWVRLPSDAMFFTQLTRLKVGASKNLRG